MMKRIAICLMLFTAGLFVIACGGNQGEDGDNVESTEAQGKEYTSAYICPMHCEGSGSEEAGKCPVCGMDYVANDEHSKDGHKH